MVYYYKLWNLLKEKLIAEEVERLKSENEELRKKYRDRFFETKVVKVEEPEEPENTEKTTFEDLFKED